MSQLQKTYRRQARSQGRQAKKSIQYAVFPVYDDDWQFWTERAIVHARAAWRLAVKSEDQAAKASI